MMQYNDDIFTPIEFEHCNRITIHHPHHQQQQQQTHLSRYRYLNMRIQIQGSRMPLTMLKNNLIYIVLIVDERDCVSHST